MHITFVLDLITCYCLLHDFSICLHEIDMEYVFIVLKGGAIVQNYVIQDYVATIARIYLFW